MSTAYLARQKHQFNLCPALFCLSNSFTVSNAWTPAKFDMTPGGTSTAGGTVIDIKSLISHGSVCEHLPVI